MMETQITRNVTIVVLLNSYDFRSRRSIDVEIKTGFETSHVFIYSDELDKVRASRRFKINYESIDFFDLAALRVICKYPVRVYCNKYTLGYIRSFDPTQEEKQI